MSETKPKLISSAIGRRKEAIASVRLHPGTGEIIVNGKKASEFFPGDFAKSRLMLPFSLLPQPVKYSVSVKVHGGGKAGQLDAVVLGISRALSLVKKDNQIIMHSARLLTRDSRKRQRRPAIEGTPYQRLGRSPDVHGNAIRFFSL